jgi:hypothetical protein
MSDIHANYVPQGPTTPPGGKKTAKTLMQIKHGLDMEKKILVEAALQSMEGAMQSQAQVTAASSAPSDGSQDHNATDLLKDSADVAPWIAQLELLKHMQWSTDHSSGIKVFSLHVASPALDIERPDAGTTESEVSKLVNKHPMPKPTPEIVGQNLNVEVIFALEAGFSYTKHPLACDVIDVVSLVVAGPLYAAKHYLGVPRPKKTEAGKDIQYAIPVPGHPSYPSGHATVSNALAVVTTALLMQAYPDQGVSGARLEAVAARIAYNRETALLHTEQDTIAGKALGVAIGQWLVSTSTLEACPSWQRIFSGAVQQLKDSETM